MRVTVPRTGLVAAGAAATALGVAEAVGGTAAWPTPVFFRKFGELIKEARIQKGLSQKQLAHRIGMKQPDVSMIEEGRKNITLYTVMRFCSVLGIKKITVDQV